MGRKRHPILRRLPVPKWQRERSPYKRARQLLKWRIGILRTLKDVAFSGLGVLSAAFALEGFLLPSGFLDGGATGITLMISRLMQLPFPAVLVVVNIPFLFIAYKLIGKSFALHATLTILSLAIVTWLFDFPEVTTDKLLVAAFGGFFMGAGIGLAVRGGSVLDGTEVLALALGRRIGITIGDVVMLINVIIFSVAAILIDVETALYAMITFVAAGKTMDLVIEGIEEYTGVTIISPHHESIRNMIGNTMGRGLTVYNGKRGFTRGAGSADVDIIYCVLTRLEVSRFLSEVQKIDANAFIVMNPVKDVKGGIMRKRRDH